MSIEKEDRMAKKEKIMLVFCVLTCLFVWVGLLSGWSYNMDTASPAGSDDPSEADDRMREIKAAVQERLAVDHKFSLTGTEVSATDTGEHTKITFNATIADPTQVASKSHLYMQSDELRYQDDTNSAFDLTSGGKLGSASTDLLANIAAISGTLDVTGNIDPTTFETTNGGFLDEDNMASDAADKVASQQSIKKYVDDTVAAEAFSPDPVVSGTVSVTFPNGLVLKWGTMAYGSGSQAKTFPTAFDTACYAVFVTAQDAAATYSLNVTAKSKTGFTVQSGSPSVDNFYWFAMGY